MPKAKKSRGAVSALATPTARTRAARACWERCAASGTRHVGWLFNTVGQADQRRYAADLVKDRGMRAIDAAEKPLILASL